MKILYVIMFSMSAFSGAVAALGHDLPMLALNAALMLFWVYRLNTAV